MFKKITTLITCGAIAFSLAACGSQDKTATETNTPKQEEKKPSQKEINESFKKEAVKGEFVEFNSDNPPADKKVFFEGKIDKLLSAVEKELKTSDYFMLKTEENGGIGVFKVLNADIDNTNKEHFKEGDTVRVYGKFMEKDALTGMPTIASPLIERVQ
ncbi:DNA-binding protein [Bacillus wiedmannii]|uniref:DNA-binding protein n=1 Tax=Bacillus wiedmannii TaxID=1890302 RepID=UPI000BF6C0C8|nr:DNA-binding protein [Bacillus wiedmannii]PGC72641.1 DNA-binding protein [Bacillus wiedmannii]